jgi:xanthine dehydrogenase accessory factor
LSHHTDVLDLVADLKSRGEAFALATVVRTVSVTAAKAGAKAVIRADGAISDGWIGGGCARAAVIKAARDAIADGTPRLVSIQPKDILAEKGLRPGEEREGVRFARNACPSQGTMDVFVEPMLPAPMIVIFGGSPVAVALADLAPRLGFQIAVGVPPEEQSLFPAADKRIDGYMVPDTGAHRFIVVSTQGRGDLAALQAALACDVERVAFVGSRRKAAALKSDLADEGLSAAQLDRLKAPAGLDIGAITPEEIALSIIAEITQWRLRDTSVPVLSVPSV